MLPPWEWQRLEGKQMRRFKDREGNFFDEEFLWDIFMEVATDYSDEEFALYLEENGLVEV